MLNEEFGSLLRLVNIRLADKWDLLSLWSLRTNMFCSVLAVPNEDAFPILVDIGFVPLFFRDDNADSTSKYLDVADVLFFSSPILLKYNLSSLTLGWKAVL